MFKQRKNTKPEIKIIAQPPKVFLTTLAYAKMVNIVDIVEKEVGWLGTAYFDVDKNIIIIDDVFLFEQEASYTTCEITESGLAKFAEKLLEEEEGIDIWNNIKVWGHSHANMGVSPSGQDDKQMEEFKVFNEWFLRIIANKNGELKIDLYDYRANISFHDLSWEIFIAEIVETRNFIEAEVKEKVKEKVYTSYKRYGAYQGINKIAIGSEDKKEESENKVLEIYNSDDEEYDILNDVQWFLTDQDVEDIALSYNFEEAKEKIKDYLGEDYTHAQCKIIFDDCVEAYMDKVYEDIDNSGSIIE